MEDYRSLDGELYLQKPIMEDGKLAEWKCNLVYELVVSPDTRKLELINNGSESQEVTPQELETNYVSLTNFFKTAVYIGRKAYREVPFATTWGIKDYSYVTPTLNPNITSKDDEPLSETVALYMGQHHMIIKTIYPFDEELTMEDDKKLRLNVIFTRDNNWFFTGPQLDTYHDQDQIVTELREKFINQKEDVLKNR